MTPTEFPLYTSGEAGGISRPGEIAYTESGLKVIRNVATPTLTAYLPDPATATGVAVVVCPGGGYHLLAFEHEGIQVVEWLNQHGIAAFMLKYRLVQTGDDFPQVVDENLRNPAWHAEVMPVYAPKINEDGRQAIRLVREHAAEWNVDPHKVGIMGFSAGGMLTLSVALVHDEAGRPDFAAPIYPAPPGGMPVPADAPPLFLLCAADDDMASAVTTQYYNEWRAAGKPVELHIYSKGGHGFGMNKLGLPSDRWIERFAEWLGTVV